MKIAKHLLMILIPGFTLSCAPRYSPIAAHTIATGENQEADVVWVTEEDVVVKRCANTQQGPVCTSAKQQ